MRSRGAAQTMGIAATLCGYKLCPPGGGGEGGKGGCMQAYTSEQKCLRPHKTIRGKFISALKYTLAYRGNKWLPSDLDRCIHGSQLSYAPGKICCVRTWLCGSQGAAQPRRRGQECRRARALCQAGVSPTTHSLRWQQRSLEWGAERN